MSVPSSAPSSRPTPLRRLRRAIAFGVASLCLVLSWGCGLLRCSHDSEYSASPYFLTPPSPWPAARELRVVTFNIHDLYWLSDHRAARMAAIGKALAELTPDIVCLQEGFVAGDVAVIGEALRAIGVEHHTDFPSGVVGSGLWTFSRFPILETFFHRFTKNGAFHDTAGGDWWAGKGVGLARVAVQPGAVLDVYNTHMICGLGPPELRAHRHLQVREFAAFVSGATPANVPALLAGDFNCQPGGREFAYLDFALRWQALREKPRGLDHILGYALFDSYAFRPLAAAPIAGKVALPDGTETSMSDHNGWLVRVQIEARQPAATGTAAGR